MRAMTQLELVLVYPFFAVMTRHDPSESRGMSFVSPTLASKVVMAYETHPFPGD